MSKFKIQHLLAIIILTGLGIIGLQWLYVRFFPEPYPNKEIYAIALIYLTEISVASYVFSSKSITLIHKNLGFKKTQIKYFLIAIVFSVLIWIANYFYQIYVFDIQMIDEAQKLMLKFKQEKFAINLMTMVILAPIVEEILFRQLMFKTFANYLSKFMAGFIVSLLFALIHFSFTDALPLFIASSFYVYLTIKSESIIPAIIAHVFNNGLTFFSYFYLLQHF